MAGEKEYSYIKKSFARNGFYSLGLSVLSFILFCVVLFRAVSGMGQSGLTTAAAGVFSMVLSLMSLWFAVLSFREPGRNRIFSGIGGCLAILLLLLWIGVISVGLTR